MLEEIFHKESRVTRINNIMKKVEENQVLKKYYEIQCYFDEKGLWCDYLSADDLARKLETSKYQIYKAFKTLKEKGYMEITRYPIYCDEYDNGLYVQDIPILFTKIYTITENGIKKIKELEEQE